MQIGRERSLDLTYCTSIHPAEGWENVERNIRRYAPALKQTLSPSAPFGLGLRLSAREAKELLAGDRLARFAGFLEDHGLYVAILNGFPYGPFHGVAVKENVYAPDWRDNARVEYTLDLIEILRLLLPAGMDGSVSTAPLSFKAWMPPDALEAGWEGMIGKLMQVAERLVRIGDEEGKLIHLDIEPEPACVIENTAEAVEFFRHKLVPIGAPLLAQACGLGIDGAREQLLKHVQLCFDCCHFAVEHEQPLKALQRLHSSGIPIGRIQLSTALRANFPADPAGAQITARKLGPFTETVYLHQVGEKRGERTRVFPDLDDALRESQADAPGTKEWCIHFHVPLFTAEYDGFAGTQDETAAVLKAAYETDFTTHLEIETYTWEVLPAGLKMDLQASIEREYEWVLGQIPGAVAARRT